MFCLFTKFKCTRQNSILAADDLLRLMIAFSMASEGGRDFKVLRQGTMASAEPLSGLML